MGANRLVATGRRLRLPLLLRTVTSRMAGNGTSSVPLPEAGQDTPASAWWRSFGCG